MNVGDIIQHARDGEITVVLVVDGDKFYYVFGIFDEDSEGSPYGRNNIGHTDWVVIDSI